MPLFSGPPDVIDDLVTVYRGAVAQDVAAESRSLDDAYALAAIFAAAEGTIADWARAVQIATSTGVALDAIGTINEGLRRQNGEDDDAYRVRLQSPPAAGSVDAILAALQLVVNSGGGGTVYLIQLPRDGIFMNRARMSMSSSVPTFSSGSAVCSRGRRISGGKVRAVIALVPASANILSAATDSLRSKVSAAKYYLVQEYA